MHPHASVDFALTPVADTLGRVSAELNDMAAMVDRMHVLAGARGPDAAALDPDYSQALQNVDYIEQKLRGIAGFLAAIAQAASPDWQLDIQKPIAAMTLSDLAARLDGRKPAKDAASDSCEFFS